MKGSILTKGVISADDGNRYSYEIADFKDERTPQNGDEVDFIIEDGKAKEIYIVKQKFSNMSMINTGTDVGKVRMMAMIGIGLMIIGALPILFFLKVIGSILMFIAVYKFSEISQSKTLFKNYLISGVISGIGFLIMFVGGLTALAGAGLGELGHDDYSGVTTGGGATVVIGVLLIIAGLYWGLKAYKELALSSGNQFFLYAFYCYIAAAVTVYFGIGMLIYVAGYILEIIAWNQLKDIKKVNETQGSL